MTAGQLERAELIIARRLMCTHWVWDRIGSGLQVRNSLLEFDPVGLWLSRLEVAHVWLGRRVPKANLLEELSESSGLSRYSTRSNCKPFSIYSGSS